MNHYITRSDWTDQF